MFWSGLECVHFFCVALYVPLCMCRVVFFVPGKLLRALCCVLCVVRVMCCVLFIYVCMFRVVHPALCFACFDLCV